MFCAYAASRWHSQRHRAAQCSSVPTRTASAPGSRAQGECWRSSHTIRAVRPLACRATGIGHWQPRPGPGPGPSESVALAAARWKPAEARSPRPPGAGRWARLQVSSPVPGRAAGPLFGHRQFPSPGHWHGRMVTVPLWQIHEDQHPAKGTYTASVGAVADRLVHAPASKNNGLGWNLNMQKIISERAKLQTLRSH